jgi:hypothetical protein
MAERSPLQKVCLQYGTDCRVLSNSHTLARFLRENGQPDMASNVEIAMARAKTVARQKYFTNRKALQPDWKDWDEQREHDLNNFYPVA